ncbi:MAG: hypothetical protein ACQEP8_03895 [Chlamydiota bacterium]
MTNDFSRVGAGHFNHFQAAANNIHKGRMEYRQVVVLTAAILWDLAEVVKTISFLPFQGLAEMFQEANKAGFTKPCFGFPQAGLSRQDQKTQQVFGKRAPEETARKRGSNAHTSIFDSSSLKLDQISPSAKEHYLTTQTIARDCLERQQKRALSVDSNAHTMPSEQRLVHIANKDQALQGLQSLAKELLEQTGGYNVDKSLVSQLRQRTILFHPDKKQGADFLQIFQKITEIMKLLNQAKDISLDTKSHQPAALQGAARPLLLTGKVVDGNLPMQSIIPALPEAIGSDSTREVSYITTPPRDSHHLAPSIRETLLTTQMTARDCLEQQQRSTLEAAIKAIDDSADVEGKTVPELREVLKVAIKAIDGSADVEGKTVAQLEDLIGKKRSELEEAIKAIDDSTSTSNQDINTLKKTLEGLKKQRQQILGELAALSGEEAPKVRDDRPMPTIPFLQEELKAAQRENQDLQGKLIQLKPEAEEISKTESNPRLREAILSFARLNSTEGTFLKNNQSNLLPEGNPKPYQFRYDTNGDPMIIKPKQKSESQQDVLRPTMYFQKRGFSKEQSLKNVDISRTQRKLAEFICNPHLRITEQEDKTFKKMLLDIMARDPKLTDGTLKYIETLLKTRFEVASVAPKTLVEELQVLRTFDQTIKSLPETAQKN